MTIKDLDSAAHELIASLNIIMEKYQLSPGITYYLLKEAESQLANLRIQEYTLSEEKPNESDEELEESPVPVENRISMSTLKKKVEQKIQEKIKNGDLDENGNGRVMLEEVMSDVSESSN